MKDLYLEEVERIAAELEEQGMDADQAYEVAGERAHFSYADRLAARVDHYRDMKKEGRI